MVWVMMPSSRSRTHTQERIMSGGEGHKCVWVGVGGGGGGGYM